MKYKTTIITVGLIVLGLFLLPLCFWDLVKEKVSPQSQIDIQFAVSVGSICGNGLLEGTEACDLGAYNGYANSGCSNVCTTVVVPEITACISQGGSWTLFSGSCVDSCESQKTGVLSPPVCDSTPTFSCSCPISTFGDDLCWDGANCALIPYCATWPLPGPGFCDPGTIVPNPPVNRCAMPPTCIPDNRTLPIVDRCDAVPTLICPDGSTAPSAVLTSPIGDPVCVWEPAGCPIIPIVVSSGGGGVSSWGGGIEPGKPRLVEPSVPICEGSNYLLGLMILLFGSGYGVVKRKELFRK